MTLAEQDQRLRALIDATIGLNSELSLDALLEKVVETAARLTEARYAALGVIDESGAELERFVTTGIDKEHHAAIGSLPRGRGILGVLIRDVQPLRLADLGDDPRSVGFPPNHPAMRSFLGVPIQLRGVPYGNLYLAEKADGEPFTADDEEIVTLLAAQAAVAIENARLYESATRWSRQVESLHDVVRSIVEQTELDTMLDLVCRKLRELIGARLAFAALPADDETLSIVAADEVDRDTPSVLGHRLPRYGSKSGRVLERGQSARVDSVFDDPEIDQEEARRLGVRTGLMVPLIVRGEPIGIIALHDKLGKSARFTEADLRLAEIFAARAAVAVDLSGRVARDTVRRVVEAQELERSRLARELHDETGQALTSILLGLKSIRAAPTEDEAAAAEEGVRELVVQALQDVRALAVELRPSALDDFGLVAALERLAQTFSERSGVAARVEAHLDGRLPPEIETTLYRFVQEALTNVVKHAQAEHVSILLTRRGPGVSAVIEDDGRGFVPEEVRKDALGIVGMRERLALLRGTLSIESQPGAGTTLVAFLPVDLQ
ncbi:MAG TPA: GAF domain-containing sensor histidine kinase [Gaiellaceae bacterium]|jgi:signal transduction histidine kinase|nr:GAF domain-containing sensor histidine kinase [Gaiellaceae bacterium]